jgi:uncharacterized membrane protein YhaH (DUF805 family)
MGFVTAVKRGLRKGLDFRGRASRPEYWWFALFALLLDLCAGLLQLPAFFLGTGPAAQILRIAGDLLIVAIILPHMAVLVRRLHDANESGWLVVALTVLYFGRPFVQPVYLIGPIWLMVLFCGVLAQLAFLICAGSEGDNKYGPPPQIATSSAVSE